MRNLILFILTVACSINTKAATSVTTSSVSGHWTMSGSPYNIYNNIQVDGSTSLIIDPGVQVVFYGPYRLMVYGSMYAAGTEAQPINFTANDTTGFSTDTVTAAGGWHGVQYLAYSGTTPDSSLFSNCNIHYVKADSMDWFAPDISPLLVRRSLNISNCTLSNNHTTPNANGFIAEFDVNANDTINVINCNFNSNWSGNATIWLGSDSGSIINFIGNKVYNNQSNICIIYDDCYITLMEKNDIYQNVSHTLGGGSGIINLFCQYATIRKNKIYDNVGMFDGALYSGYGLVDIIGNLICNNKHLIGAGCGIVDGGGGLNLCAPVSGTPVNTFYNVRENVIANNYSPFHGGGINLLESDANITNNQFINNMSTAGAAINLVIDVTHKLVVKNNVFYGNTSTPDTLHPCAMEGAASGIIEYDHNWQQRSTRAMLNMGGTYTLIGDTATNIIGTGPGLVAPTHTALVTESAVAADFSLLAISSCIDNGDTAGVICDSFDYADNSRIYGSHIDIGAFEYRPSIAGIQAVASTTPKLNIYPNPAANKVFIATASAEGTIYLQDLSGRTIMKQQVTGTLSQLDIRLVPRGVYLAVWYGENGSKEVQKVVVE